MDPDHMQAIAERDQFWTSLRALAPEIQRLAAGEFGGSERERMLLQVLARCVLAELAFRDREATGG
jgi:hypothetical protein